MKLLHANEYAKSRGYPYPMIRRLCQDGTLPADRTGRKYLIYADEADAVMQSRKHTEKYTPKQRQQAPVKQSRRIVVRPLDVARDGKLSFLEELKKLAKAR